MDMMSRRELLASAAAVTLFAPGKGLAFSPPLPPPPPRAEATGVSEIVHGKRIADPYRWMENKADPRWEPFITGQGAYARTFLDSIPEHSAFLKRIAELVAKPAPSEVVGSAGGRFFTFSRSAGQESLSLWVRETPQGPDRLLVDPADLAPPGAIGGIDYYWNPSPDGRHLVFGFFLNGAEDLVLRIVDVQTGKLLGDRIERADMSGRPWAPDGSGFFYRRLSGGAGTDKYKKSRAMFHRLGTDPAHDLPIMGYGLHTGVEIADSEFPEIVCEAGSPFLIGYLGRVGVQIGDVYVTNLADAVAGRHVWRRVATAADGVTLIAPWGEHVCLSATRGGKAERLLKFAGNADIGQAVEIPIVGDVVMGLAPARNGLYVQVKRAGSDTLTRIDPRGGLHAVELPAGGAIPFGISASSNDDGLWTVVQSWVMPPTIYRVGADDRAVMIARPGDAGKTSYAAELVMVPARDGVKVPLSIVYDPARPRDGSSPMIMTAYGSYGSTLDPRYTPADIAWMERGGSLAVAHVRGGGELGEQWHKAGFKATKANSWRDVIDCGRWLVKNGYTSHKRLAIQGKSAGGISVGRALTEAPDEFAAAILRVPEVNTMRQHMQPNGPANAEEFGRIDDPAEAGWLFEMDAYQHVVPGKRYPPVLLTTGLEDPRVPPWQPGKMAAKLQAVSCAPTILRVVAKGGHGLGSTKQQEVEEKADIFSFVWLAAHSPKVGCA